MPKAKAEKAPKAEKPEKKEKKVKDPNAPKKALGSYMFFCADQRAQLKKEQPDLKVTEVAQILGARWKDLDDKGKAKFTAQAEKDKERYAKEMAAYQS